MAAFLQDIAKGTPALNKVETEGRGSAVLAEAQLKTAITGGKLNENLKHVDAPERAGLSEAKTKAAISGGQLNANLKKTAGPKDESINIAKKLYLEEKEAAKGEAA